MKKSLIALAVAGAMTAPLVAQADATIYGDIEYNVNFADDTDLDASLGHVRLGVKGTVDNDIDGLTTGYQIEVQMPSTDATFGDVNGTIRTRQANLYMSGDFGTVIFGNQSSIADNADRNMGQDGDYLSMLTDRVEAIGYVTPDMGGFTAGLGLVADSGEAAEEDLDAYMIALGYSVDALSFDLTWTDSDEDGMQGDGEILALGATYSVDTLEVILGYQDAEFSGVDATYWTLGAGYGIGKTTVYGEYSNLDVDGAADDATMVLVGADYALGKKAKVGVEYYSFNDQGEAVVGPDYLSLFYRLKF